MSMMELSCALTVQFGMLPGMSHCQVPGNTCDPIRNLPLAFGPAGSVLAVGTAGAAGARGLSVAAGIVSCCQCSGGESDPLVPFRAVVLIGGPNEVEGQLVMAYKPLDIHRQRSSSAASRRCKGPLKLATVLPRLPLTEPPEAQGCPD